MKQRVVGEMHLDQIDLQRVVVLAALPFASDSTLVAAHVVAAVVVLPAVDLVAVGLVVEDPEGVDLDAGDGVILTDVKVEIGAG